MKNKEIQRTLLANKISNLEKNLADIDRKIQRLESEKQKQQNKKLRLEEILANFGRPKKQEIPNSRNQIPEDLDLGSIPEIEEPSSSKSELNSLDFF